MTLSEKRQQIINFLGLNPAIDGTGIKVSSLEGRKKDQDAHCEQVIDVLEEYSNVEIFQPEMENGWIYTSTTDGDNFKEYIDKCIANDVRIITCSKDCSINKERLEYIKKAYDNGIIIVVAADNDGVEITESETGDLRRNPYVLTISSYYLDENDNMKWGGHNYGKVDAIAPTYVPIDTNEDGTLDINIFGSSFATPLKAIMLAECVRLNPRIDSKNVKEFIEYLGQDFECHRGTFKFIQLHDKEKIKSFFKNSEEKEACDMLSPYKKSYRISQHYSEKHTGIDLVGIEEKYIYAVTDGVIDFAGWENPNNKKQGFGMYVRVKGTDGLYYYYGHLNWIHEDLYVGKEIKKGTLLGLEGSTGKSTGSHLHLEIRKKPGVITNMKDSVNVEELLEKKEENIIDFLYDLKILTNKEYWESKLIEVPYLENLLENVRNYIKNN